MLIRLIKCVFVAMMVGAIAVAAKPMEPLTKTLFVFVHGTTDAGAGYLESDCKPNPSKFLANELTFGSFRYNMTHNFVEYFKKDVLPLNINPVPYIFNIRPFLNPSESPDKLAHELGDRTWISSGCPAGGDQPHSLIEDAVENWFQLVGISLINPTTHINWKTLQEMRDHQEGRKLIPCRVVVVAHSTGGVTAREYFTSDFYNGDVDKYISMDSPHEGTSALSALFDARDFDPSKVAVGTYNTLAFPMALLLYAANTPISDIASTNLLLYWVSQAVLPELAAKGIGEIVANMNLDLQHSDGIVGYIRPGSPGITALNARPGAGNGNPIPAIRLYHSQNGICFGAPADVQVPAPLSYIIPPVFVGGIGNLANGISNGLPAGHVSFATAMGMATGVNWSENGSSIIPRWSSNPKSVAVFNQAGADVLKIGYEPHGTGTATTLVSTLTALSAANFVLSSIALTLGFDQSLVKISMNVAAAIPLAGELISMANLSVGPYGKEFQDGHFYPMFSPEKLKGTSRSYAAFTDRTKIISVQKSSFEDFVFEKPFVQLRATSINDGLTDDEAKDPAALEELGIYDQAGAPLAKLPTAALTGKPIDYNKPNWDEGIGVKKTQYRYTTGTSTTDKPVLNKVNRYQLAPFALNTTAYKYVFEVDDVLPQFMEQIKVNFNWNYSLIWQRENASTTTPYKLYREDFGVIAFVADVASPIDANGVFEVKPFDPLYFKPTELKSLVQKENQNVITVSMVNRAGYATSQQMFFLAVMTKPILEAYWPLPGASLTTRNPQVWVHSNLFAFHNSGLFYDLGTSPVRTGFKFVVPGPFGTTSAIPSTNLIKYDQVPSSATDLGEDFIHKWASSTGNIPATQGNYLFFAQVQTKITATGQLVDNYVQRIPFAYDITAPAVALGIPDVPINPKTLNSALAFNFKQGKNISAGEETALRFARARVIQGASTVYEFAPRDNLINPGVAYFWEGTDKDGAEIPEGKYTFQVAALDYAVPNRDAYDKVTALHTKFNAAKDNELPAGFETDWGVVADGFSSIKTGFNGKILSKDFIIDRTPPQIQLVLKAVPAPGAVSAIPVDLTGDGILNRSEKLRIEFKVIDRKSSIAAPIKVSWRFTGNNGTTSATYPASQTIMTSVDQFADATVSTFDEILSAASFADGKYTVTAQLEDEAGNRTVEITQSDWKFTVDRTPPRVEAFHTNSLTYRSGSTSAGNALWSIDEGGDIGDNQDGSKLVCQSRNQNPDGIYSSWAKTDALDKTALPKSQFAGKKGQWTVEVNCVDAAGNESVRAFKYFVDRIFPEITSPSGSAPIKSGKIAIYGMAPNPEIFGLENVGSYTLSWKMSGTTTWNVDKIFVPATRQGVGRKPNVSETVSPTVDYLGYWDATGLVGTYEIQLEASSCIGCAGETVKSQVIVSDVASASEFAFTLTKSFPEPLVPGSGKSVDFGLKFTSNSDAEVEMEGKIFGIDAARNVLFEADLTGISASRLHGKPATFAMDGFYLWQEPSGQWQAQVKNVLSAFNLSLNYFYEAGKIPFQATYLGKPVKCTVLEQATGKILVTGDNPVGFKCTELILPVSQTLQNGFNGPANRQILIDAAGGASQAFAFTLGSKALANFTYVRGTGASGNLVPTDKVFVGKNAVNLKGIAPGTANDFFSPLVLLSTSDDRVFPWNTRRQNDGIPKAGLAMVRAEMTAISPDGSRRAQVAEVPVNIASVDLDLSIGRQSPFLTLKESIDAELGRITLTYGVHGQDALVTAGVRKTGTQEIVKTFMSKKTHTATVLTNDKEISWSGITDRNFLADAGNYEFFVQAYRNATDTDPVTRSVAFEIRFADFIDVSNGDDPGLILQVPEAKPLSTEVSYVVPRSDYRITAMPVGQMEAPRDFQYQVEYAGKQRLTVYPAQRYSVGLQRKREEFRVIIWVKMVAHGDHIDDWTDGCGSNARDFFLVDGKSFTFTKGQEEVFDVAMGVGGMDIVGLYVRNSSRTRRPFDLEIKAIRISSGLPVTPGSVDEFDKVLKEDVLWSHQINNFKDDPDPTPISIAHVADPCTPGGDISDVKICKDKSQPQDGDSKAYDANKNLLEVTINHRDANPGSFSWGDFSDGGCWEHDHSDQAFGAKITMKVPLEYWEPGFGMDNLANRNLRFDPTSQTMAEYFEKDGFAHNNAGPNLTSDNHYLWLNPFEFQRYRLLPVSKTFLADPGNTLKLNPLSFGAEENPLVKDEKIKYQFFRGPLSPALELTWSASQCTRLKTGTPPFDPVCTEPATIIGSAVNPPATTDEIAYDAFASNGSYWGLRNYFFEIRLKDVNFQEILNNSILEDVQMEWPAKTAAPIDATRRPVVPTETPPDARFCGSQTDPAEGCLKAYNGTSGIEYFLADGSGKVNKRPLSEYVDRSNNVMTGVNPDFPGAVDFIHLGQSSTPVISANVSVLDPVTHLRSFNDVDHFKSAGSVLADRQGASNQYDLTSVVSATAKPVAITHGVTADLSTPGLFVQAPPVSWDGSKDPHLKARDLDKDGLVDEETSDLSDVDQDHGTGEDAPGYLSATIKEDPDPSKKTKHIPQAGQPYKINLLSHVYDPGIDPADRTASPDAMFKYGTDWTSNAANVSLRDIEVRNIDGSINDAIEVEGHPTTLSLAAFDDLKMAEWNLVRKTNGFARSKELITIRGRVPESATTLGTPYHVNYLNSAGLLKTAFEGYYTRTGALATPEPILGYLDVSLLQGNTSLFLTYSVGAKTYFRKLNVQIGRPVGTTTGFDAANSLYGDAAVYFNPNSFEGKQEFVTVRVISPAELEMSQRNQLSVVGPVVEVLPSHDFGTLAETEQPIVTINISRQELGSTRLPGSIKIYRPDHATDNLVELHNQTYLFYDESHVPVCLPAPPAKNTTGICAEDWAWFTITGNTSSFSDFVALDKTAIFSGAFTLDVTPVFSKDLDRTVTITGLGLTEYKIFVDDDAYYLNAGDATPKQEAALSGVGVVGSVLTGTITLPDRFSSHLFLVPMVGGELATSQVKSVEVFHSVDAFSFKYTGPATVPMGTVNGKVVLPYESNHPGTLQLVLNKSGANAGMLRDAMSVPGGSYIWDGNVNGVPLPAGTYQSTLSAIDLDGEGALVPGPDIVVDGKAPLATLSGSLSGDLVYLDFQCSDNESGLTSAELELDIEGEALFHENLSGLPAACLGRRQITLPVRFRETCRSCELLATLTVTDNAANSVKAEWRSNASRSWKAVSLNTTASGANVPSILHDFPVLIRLDASNFDFGSARPDGLDLRFSDADGSPLPFEIESWNAGLKTAAVWVKTDVPGNAVSTIYMQWGVPLSTGGSNSRDVFSKANGFAGVWHLGEQGNSNPAGYSDATGNGNDGTGMNLGNGSAAPGIAGLGQAFNGQNQYIQLPQSAPGPLNFPSDGQYTLSAWVRSDVLDDKYHTIISKGDNQYGLQMVRENSWEFFEANGSNWQSNTNQAAKAEWFLVTGVSNGSSQSLFVNGVLVDNTITSIGGAVRSTSFEVNFGRNSQKAGTFFSGQLDEINISNVPRSADWIRLNYENQKPHQTLVSVNGENFADWLFVRPLVLNTSATGANVSGDVQNFPVLVRLRNSDFDFSQAKASGGDLRFALPKGLPLEYEIERWDASAKIADIWVLVPKIQGNNSAQSINMFWGNPSADSRSSSQNVFQTGDDYRSVWHMGEDPQGDHRILDATFYGNHGNSQGNMTSVNQVEGRTGRGLALNGTGNHILHQFPLNKLEGTISAWMRPDQIRNMDGFYESDGTGSIYNGFGTGASSLETDVGILNGKWNFTYQDGPTVGLGGGVPVVGRWDHVVFKWDRTRVAKLFVNGQKTAEADLSSASFASKPASVFKLGAVGNGQSDRFWKGGLDEMRILGREMSDDWVRLSYENQKDGQSLVQPVNNAGGKASAIQLGGQVADVNYSITGTQWFKIPLALYSNTWSHSVMAALDDMDGKVMEGQFKFEFGTGQPLSQWFQSFPTEYSGQDAIYFTVTVPGTRRYKVRWWFQ